MCVNSDTESVLYRNIDLFDSFEAYAPDGALAVGSSTSVPRAEGTWDERIARSPDRLYSDRLDDLAIEISKEEQTVTLYPELSVCRYRVEIRNVSNLKYLSPEGLSGSLSGLSGGFRVGRNELTPDPATVPSRWFPTDLHANGGISGFRPSGDGRTGAQAGDLRYHG